MTINSKKLLIVFALACLNGCSQEEKTSQKQKSVQKPTNHNQPQTKLSWFLSNNQLIMDSVVKWLNSNSLSPYIAKGKTVVNPLGFDEQVVADQKTEVGFLFAELYQKPTQKFKSVFTIIRNKQDNSVTAKLLYMGDDTISTQLFFDLLYHPGVLMEIQDFNSSFNIYLKKSPLKSTGEWKIDLTIFNPSKSRKLDITLTQDGNGGNYFSIKKAK